MERNSMTRSGCVRNRGMIWTRSTKMEKDHNKSNARNGRKLSISKWRWRRKFLFHYYLLPVKTECANLEQISFAGIVNGGAVRELEDRCVLPRIRDGEADGEADRVVAMLGSHLTQAAINLCLQIRIHRQHLNNLLHAQHTLHLFFLLHWCATITFLTITLTVLGTEREWRCFFLIIIRWRRRWKEEQVFWVSVLLLKITNNASHIHGDST